MDFLTSASNRTWKQNGKDIYNCGIYLATVNSFCSPSVFYSSWA